MIEVLQSTTGQLVLGTSGLVALTAVGVYVVLKLRDSIGSDDSSVDLIEKFREMRHEGHIDEEEFRTIKTDLGEQLSQQSLGEIPRRDR